MRPSLSPTMRPIMPESASCRKRVSLRRNASSACLRAVSSPLGQPQPPPARGRRQGVALAARAQRRLRPLALGDVAPDRLDLDHVASVVNDGMLDPVLPALVAIGPHHLMLIADDAGVLHEVPEAGL